MNKKRLILVAAIALIITLIFTDTYLGRYVRWFLPDVYDLNKFPYEKVENGESKLKIPKKPSDLINEISFELNGNKNNLDELINNTRTNAFIILHNDTIIYENYTKDNTDTSLFKAYSATKSILSALIGIAIDEGKIKSIDELNSVLFFNKLNE